jgi:hypothetical protein
MESPAKENIDVEVPTLLSLEQIGKAKQSKTSHTRTRTRTHTHTHTHTQKKTFLRNTSYLPPGKHEIILLFEAEL